MKAKTLTRTLYNITYYKKSQICIRPAARLSHMLINMFGVLTLNLSCKLRNQAEHYAQRFLLHCLQPNLYQGCCIFSSQCRENALHHEQVTCWDHLDSCKQRKDLIRNLCSKKKGRRRRREEEEKEKNKEEKNEEEKKNEEDEEEAEKEKEMETKEKEDEGEEKRRRKRRKGGAGGGERGEEGEEEEGG